MKGFLYFVKSVAVFLFFVTLADAKDLRLRLTSDPVTLDWNLARSSHETHIIMNFMEGLVEVGQDLNPIPALALKWEISSDNKIYTFHIRPNVVWSDGKKLSASDFKNSWLRLLDPKSKSNYANFLFDIENAEEFYKGKIKNPDQVGIRAKSDLLLEVRLKNPVHYFLYLPSFWVTFPIRLDVIKKYGKNWFLPGHVVTLGPYLLDGWEKNKFILLKKNSLYYRSEVFNANTPEKVTFMIEPDDQKARTLFEQSKVDVFLDATTQDLINKNPKTKILQFPYLATYYLGFQVGVGPIKDLDVRKAIACSIDTHQIPSILQGGQIEATGWIPQELLAELQGNRMPLNCTLFDAKASLSKAGYPEGKGFPVLNLFIEKFDGASLLAQEIQKSLKEKLGIKIQTQITTQTKFLKATRSNQAGLFITHWGADFPDPANFFELFLSDNNANLTFWKKQEYDQKVKAARQTLQQKERFVLFDEAEKILIQKEFVILPLFYRKNTVLVHDHIKSFSVTPLNYLFFKNVVLN